MKALATELAESIQPPPQPRQLLRACLEPGPAAHEAWQAWRGGVRDAVSALSDSAVGLRRLLPLLHQAVIRHGLTDEKSILTLLRTAALRDEARHATFARIVAPALAALAESGRDFLVLKGAALAYTVYDEPALRHCHDLDLLVREEDWAAVRPLLRKLGFSSDSLIGPGHLRFLHRSGLPLVLHAQPFRFAYYTLPFAELWSRGVPARVAGVSARIPSPADQLLHVCGHASYSTTRRSQVWVADAWHLLKKHPDLDWDGVVRGAAGSRLGLPLAAALKALAACVTLPIPDAVMARLQEQAEQAEAVGRDLARFGASRHLGEYLRRLAGASAGRPARKMILESVLLPPVSAVRAVYPQRGAAGLALWYAGCALRRLGLALRNV